MIDEIRETETVTQTAQSETFDLEAAIAAHIAEQDQREAARREAQERAQQEQRVIAVAEAWKGICEAFPPHVRAALGITGPDMLQEYQGYQTVLPVPIDGKTFAIVASRHEFELWAPGRVMESGWISSQPDQVLPCFIALIARYREWKAAAAEAEAEAEAVQQAAEDRAYNAMAPAASGGTPANGPWEPQLLGSDHYRSTYVLNADKGCGSLSQHQMTLAEVTAAGDVILSRVYFGRAGMKRAIEEIQLHGAELRALWPLWQQATAEKAEADEKAAENEATEDIPF